MSGRHLLDSADPKFISPGDSFFCFQELQPQQPTKLQTHQKPFVDPKNDSHDPNTPCHTKLTSRMLLQKLLRRPLQSLIIQNTPNFDVIWRQYNWVRLCVCPRVLPNSTASDSSLMGYTHTEFPPFPRGNRPRDLQKRLKPTKVDCRSLTCPKNSVVPSVSNKTFVEGK